MHHSAQGSGEPWRWEDKKDVHKGTNQEMERGIDSEKLKKGFTLRSGPNFGVLGPFAECVKCFLKAQWVAFTLDF